MSKFVDIFKNIMIQEFGDRIEDMSVELSGLKRHYNLNLVMSYFNDDDMVKVVTRITKITWMITKWSVMAINNKISINFYITTMVDD